MTSLPATFTLTNGQLGDDTPAGDGMIIEPGGPAARILVPSVPVASNPGLGPQVNHIIIAVEPRALRLEPERPKVDRTIQPSFDHRNTLMMLAPRGS